MGGGYDKALEALNHHARASYSPECWHAVADRVFQEWDSAVVYGKHTSFRDLFQKFVMYRKNNKAPKYNKTRPRGTVTPKREDRSQSSASFHPPALTPTKRHAGRSVTFDQPVRKFAAYTRPTCCTDPSWRGNDIGVKIMSMFVSREADWTGEGTPKDSKVRQISSFLPDGSDILSDPTTIVEWLTSSEIRWDPEKESAKIFNPEKGFHLCINDDPEALIVAIMSQHSQNQPWLKLRITPKDGAILNDVAHLRLDDEEPTELELDELDMSGREVEAVTLEKSDLPLLDVAPPSTREIGDAERLMARFTKEAYNEARVFFQLEPVKIMTTEKVRVRWIRRTLFPHQLLFLHQAILMLIEHE
jgi:hypothetical protein